MIVFNIYAIGSISMADIFNEEWRAIPGYDGLYSASSFGRVRQERRQVFYSDGRSSYMIPARIKKQSISSNKRYWRVTLTKSGQKSKNVFVHRLIAWAFIGPQAPKIETRHINGNGFDNRPHNLHYGTKADNMRDAIAHGTFSMGEVHPEAILTGEQVKAILMDSRAATLIAPEYGVSHIYIRKIRRGQARRSEIKALIDKQPKRIIKTKFQCLSEEHLNILKDLKIQQRAAGKLLGVPQRTIWRWRKQVVCIK